MAERVDMPRVVGAEVEVRDGHPRLIVSYADGRRAEVDWEFGPRFLRYGLDVAVVGDRAFPEQRVELGPGDVPGLEFGQELRGATRDAATVRVVERFRRMVDGADTFREGPLAID